MTLIRDIWLFLTAIHSYTWHSTRNMIAEILLKVRSAYKNVTKYNTAK